jgi:hypothetical protein
MTIVRPLPGFGESHPSLAAFYAADARRWSSREHDLGLRWKAAGGSTYRAAFVEATGELYLFEHQRANGGGGMVFVHDRTAPEIARSLKGWQNVCGEDDSFQWLLDRLGGSG